MNTFLIKKEHLDKDNFYVGKEDLSNYQGHIEAEENLGTIRFKTELIASGNIYFRTGSGIKAGWGIEAGGGLEAGGGIICKGELSSKLRIFAGLVTWRMPTKEEMQIKVGKLVLGQVCYGELIETGLPKEDCCDGKVIEIEGKKYQLKSI
jgi:hypothetical protein